MSVLCVRYLQLAHFRKGWEPFIIKERGKMESPTQQVPRADTGPTDAAGYLSRVWLLRQNTSAEPLGCPHKTKLYKALPLSSSTKQASLLREAIFFFFSSTKLLREMYPEKLSIGNIAADSIFGHDELQYILPLTAFHIYL